MARPAKSVSLSGIPHPRGVAALMPGVGTGDREAVSHADAHRVVVERPRQGRWDWCRGSCRSIPRLAATSPCGCPKRAMSFERRRDAAERGESAERRDAFATVVPRSETGRVGRDSPGHVRHGADRAGECRQSASLPWRAARHDERARVHHLRGCDRRVRQRQRSQPLALSGGLRRSLCDCSSRREDDRKYHQPTHA